MRRITFTSKLLGGGAAVAVAMGLTGCKGDLDPDPDFDLIPPVGQAVASGEVPLTIEPNSLAALEASDPAAFALAGGVAPEPELQIPTIDYEVQKGDYLGKIAGQFGTSVGTVQKLNGLTGTFIRYGQTLKVPAPAGTAPAPESTTPVAVEEVPAAPVAPAAPTPPAGIDVRPPAPAPSLGTPVGGAETGFGFGGASAPRPRTPSRAGGTLPELEAPN